jgi:hypothetical protein
MPVAHLGHDLASMAQSLQILLFLSVHIQQKQHAWYVSYNDKHFSVSLLKYGVIKTPPSHVRLVKDCDSSASNVRHQLMCLWKLVSSQYIQNNTYFTQD